MATVTLQRVRPFQEIQNGVLFGPVTNNLYNINGLGQVTVDTLDQANLLTQGWLPPLGGSAGAGGAIGIPLFGTVGDAQAAVIPDTVNTIQVTGYNAPGDGGGGTYGRVAGLPSLYTGNAISQVLPPSITSGVPVLVFSSVNNSFQEGQEGPTLRSINAGDLTVVIMEQMSTVPSSITDSVGNVYVFAVQIAGGAFTAAGGIYYCVNPAAVPSGSTFNIKSAEPFGAVSVYTCPGFSGASLDKIASVASSTAGSATLTTPALTPASSQLVFAFAGVTRGTYLDSGVGPPFLSYTVPAGWVDLSPPLQGGRNPKACTVVSNAAPVTFSTTWSGPATSGPYPVVMATFRTYPRSSLDPSYWTLFPTWPVHTTQYGISPAGFDNRAPFINFSRWLASIAPPSSTSDGRFIALPFGGTASGTATISIGSPAVISLNLPTVPVGNGMQLTARNGQAISFSTTGTLPAPIVAGKIYYVQYGSVKAAVYSGGTLVSSGSIQISETSIFNNDLAAATSPKGTPISTAGATQHGTHSFTLYGENWTDFVVDPGIYHSSNSVAPGKGVGLKRWRMRGPGARFQSGVFIDGVVWNDINASTDSSGVVYSAKFKTTKMDSGGLNPDHVVLFNPAEVSHFYVNSWVLLMALELQVSQSGNWNQYYFEYIKVKSIDATAGVITFYDKLQHNYRSTYPRFPPKLGAWPGTSIGPATIVQINDTFDQEIEINSVTFSGVTEMNFAGVLSLRMVDCYVYGWGYKTGPFPSTMKQFTMERCVIENSQVEVDKMIDTQHYIDCTFDKNSSLIIQSSSTNKMIIDRCKMYGGMAGTPKDLTVRDSHIAGTFFFGTAYGGTERMLLENTHITYVDSSRAQSIITTVKDIVFSNGTIKVLVGTTVPAIGATWNGPGVVPSGCPIMWCAPSTKVMLYSNSVNSGAPALGGPMADRTNGMILAFTVLDAYTDPAGNFCVDTDLPALPATSIDVTGSIAAGTSTLVVTAISPSDALPLNGMTIVPVSGGDLPVGTVINSAVGAPNTASPLNTGSYTLSNPSAAGYAAGSHFTVSDNFSFLQHPCPRLTVRDCTGGAFATDWSGAPPDIPMYSYFKRAFAGFPFATYPISWLYVPLAGNLLSWTIDVKKPYTGAAASYICTISMLGWKNASGNYYPTWMNQTINLKTAGVRTITAAATSGGVAGDTLAAIPFWLTGAHWVATGTPAASGIASGAAAGGDTLAQMPMFVMTAQADQGIGFGSEVVSTLNSGNDLLTDSTTHAGNDNPPVAFAATFYYVGEGDSVTAGAGVAGYPALYGVGNSSATISNLATGGAFLADLQQRLPMLDHIISFKRPGDRYVLSVMVGTNDACFGYTGGTRTAFLTQLAAYLDHNRSAGWYVILCTQISRGAPATVSGAGTSGGTPDSELIPINAELRLWAITGGSIVSGLHADEICDFASNAAFLPGGTVYNNTTNYQPDKTHPNAAGENLLYTIIKPHIDGTFVFRVAGTAAGTSTAQAFPFTVFNPTSLFASGEHGGWYDVSDHSTTFQDTAGTIPATTAGQTVKRINDKSGNGSHLTSSVGCTLQNSGALWWLQFDGATQYLQVAVAPFDKPVTVVTAARQITYAAGNTRLWSGFAGATAAVLQNGSSPQITLYNGLFGPTDAANMTVGTDHVVIDVSNGASSTLQVDNNTINTGDSGGGNPGGITIGADGFISFFSNIRWYGAIHINRTLTTGETNSSRTFIGAKAGLVL